MQDDILDLINEEFETGYELDAPAAAVLVSGGPTLRRQSSKGAGGGGGGGTWASLLGGDDLVSSDTDDDDFRCVWVLGFRVYLGFRASSHHVRQGREMHRYEGTNSRDRICTDNNLGLSWFRL